MPFLGILLRWWLGQLWKKSCWYQQVVKSALLHLCDKKHDALFDVLLD